MVEGLLLITFLDLNFLNLFFSSSVILFSPSSTPSTTKQTQEISENWKIKNIFSSSSFGLVLLSLFKNRVETNYMQINGLPNFEDIKTRWKKKTRCSFVRCCCCWAGDIGWNECEMKKLWNFDNFNLIPFYKFFSAISCEFKISALFPMWRYKLGERRRVWVS